MRVRKRRRGRIPLMYIGHLPLVKSHQFVLTFTMLHSNVLNDCGRLIGLVCKASAVVGQGTRTYRTAVAVEQDSLQSLGVRDHAPADTSHLGSRTLREIS